MTILLAADDENLRKLTVAPKPIGARERRWRRPAREGIDDREGPTRPPFSAFARFFAAAVAGGYRVGMEEGTRCPKCRRRRRLNTRITPAPPSPP